MTISRFALIAAFGSLMFLGHVLKAEMPTVAPVESPAAGPFDKDLLKIAAEYKSWGRVDDEMRWAPELCRIPNPGRPRFSASADETTHGQKLYSLLTKQRRDYLALVKNKKVPVGFAIVKESWAHEEVSEPNLKPDGGIDRAKIISKIDLKGGRASDAFYPYAIKGGKLFKATKQSNLFVMMKFDRDMAETDDGWVYGTLTPDGKQVTAAGKIESCMKCHHDAPHDRLFGLR